MVASFYPLAWAAERVAGDAVAEIVNLTPAGAEPHDIELSPSDVETIRDAQLVVYIGGGFQPALEDAIDGRDGASLDLLEGDEDPHIWLDRSALPRPSNASHTEWAAPPARFAH